MSDWVLVWDSSALLHAARSDRVDVLAELAKPWVNVTTSAVLQELDRQGPLAAWALAPEWLREVHVDGLDELAALVRWVQVVGARDGHHRGEATVLAWAEAHEATAIVDDWAARQAATNAGLTVHGTLWLCAQAVQDDRVNEVGVAGFIDALLKDGARLPLASGRAFGAWARQEGLL